MPALLPEMLISLVSHSVEQRFSTFGVTGNLPEELLKHKLLNPTLRVAHSVGLGEGPKIYILISSKVMLILLV